MFGSSVDVFSNRRPGLFQHFKRNFERAQKIEDSIKFKTFCAQMLRITSRFDLAKHFLGVRCNLFSFCILLLKLITRVIMCLELTFNKKDKFLLYRLFVILLHFAAIVVVASFYNPHAIPHTSAVLHNESVFSPNNKWRWSTFCQTPQE